MTQTFECPNCGGHLEFDAITQQLKCPFCDGTFDPKTFEPGQGYDNHSETWEDSSLVSYICPSCGGEILASSQTNATTCPYCGNPVVVNLNHDNVLKPSRIIPFQYTKKDAKERFKEFLEHKTLVPKSFKEDTFIDEIKGLYVPFWIFDGVANMQAWYKATKSRTWEDRDFRYVETSYYNIYRSGFVSFDDVPVDASSKMDDEMMQSIEPFDSTMLTDFSENYLAGYYADQYDVSSEDCRDTADQRVYHSTKELLRDTVFGYDTISLVNDKFSIAEGTQEYVMYPCWYLNIKYKGKNYPFIMNGQTGKFVGDLPCDGKKLFLILLLTFLGVFVVVSIIQWFYLGGRL